MRFRVYFGGCSPKMELVPRALPVGLHTGYRLSTIDLPNRVRKILDYVEVILDTWGERKLCYYVPAFLKGKLREGTRVIVPVGKKKTIGFVVNLLPNVPLVKTKAVEKLVDEIPLLSKPLFTFTQKLSQYYAYPWKEVLKTTLPPGFRNKDVKLEKDKKLKINFALPNYLQIIQDLEKKAPQQKKVVDILLANQGKMDLRDIKTSSQVIKRLKEKGLITQIEEAKKPSLADQHKGISTPFSLTPEQKKALEEILFYLENNRPKTFLLHGITASGKTEIYMQVISHSLTQGRGAIVLVPEISLTPQMIRNFQERFGERIAVLHSQLTPSRRFKEWMRIKNGEADIVLGARSAIFAPLDNLGIIVIDESHEATYKQNEKFRYDARQAALLRGQIQKCVVILGSATPRVEDYHQATKGKYTLLELSSRVEDRPLPNITIVDLKREKEMGNRGILSHRLRNSIKESLAKGGQVVLFLNRRGFSPVLMCFRCRYVVRCKHCRLALTYHTSTSQMLCHHCGYQTNLERICPNCQKGYLQVWGVGTQQVEKEIKKYFPESKVARMDSDTTKKRGSHQYILQDFWEKKTDLLVGTQMIAKGLHFPNVTLVGIVSADTQLNLPDFRAGENTFQLLTQVAGRSGRGEKGGEVIVQTYTPEHYSIKCACNYDFPSFYQQELSFRKELGYPPFTQLVSLIIKGLNENRVRRSSILLEKLLKEDNGPKCPLIGPAPCPLEKIRDKYRWRIMVKCRNQQNREDILLRAKSCWKRIPRKDENLIIDVDPIDMM